MPHRFRIDPWLEAESAPVGDLPLCAVLLRDDRRFPWLVLIPRLPGLVEIFDLSAPDRTRLIEEIALASRILKAVTNCQKLNTAALGLIVHQLHVHVVARFADDIAGTGTVWGAGEPVLYETAARDAIVSKLKHGFGFA
ncbi:MAG TPA: HIT family protein [Xanthobacteraceae bacterium]|jgi:diadenosine tetraphosphate (Ap4A) HIT family hydrolase